MAILTPALKKALESRLYKVKTEKAKQGEWSIASEKPGFSMSSKHMSGMPEALPGQKVKMVLECNVTECKINEDGSREYRFEIEKAGTVE